MNARCYSGTGIGRVPLAHFSHPRLVTLQPTQTEPETTPLLPLGPAAPPLDLTALHEQLEARMHFVREARARYRAARTVTQDMLDFEFSI